MEILRIVEEQRFPKGKDLISERGYQNGIHFHAGHEKTGTARACLTAEHTPTEQETGFSQCDISRFANVHWENYALKRKHHLKSKRFEPKHFKHSKHSNGSNDTTRSIRNTRTLRTLQHFETFEQRERYNTGSVRNTQTKRGTRHMAKFNSATTQQKKELLQTYRVLKVQEKQLLNEIEEITTLRSSVIDGLPHGSGTPSDPTAQSVIQMIDRHTKWNATVRDIRRKMEMIAAAIGRVRDANERTILILRYVRGLTLERISVEMDYSFRQIVRLHGVAIKHIEFFDTAAEDEAAAEKTA